METEKTVKLASIKGTLPDLRFPIKGCAFGPRCEKRMGICIKSAPPIFEVEGRHRVACWRRHADFLSKKKEGK